MTAQAIAVGFATLGSPKGRRKRAFPTERAVFEGFIDHLLGELGFGGRKDGGQCTTPTVFMQPNVFLSVENFVQSFAQQQVGEFPKDGFVANEGFHLLPRFDQVQEALKFHWPKSVVHGVSEIACFIASVGLAQGRL